MENWHDEFLNDIQVGNEEYFLTVKRTTHCIAPDLYTAENGELHHSNALGEIPDNKVFSVYMKYWEKLACGGIHIFRYAQGQLVESKLVKEYNPELFDTTAMLLALHQEYGLEPVNEWLKGQLKEALKAEKIKKTLVYACFVNDTEEILKRVEKASNGQLNKVLQYTGTPLGLCAENDNLTAFRAIAEKGADLNKKSIAYKPLKIAFHKSPAIVWYMYENHREYFESEIAKERFGYAYRCTDTALLQLLWDRGLFDEGNKKEYPDLLNFADNNNTVGIQFLFDKGVSMDTVNSHGQTAIDRAKSSGAKDALALLEKLMNAR